ncbi:MAG: hypothetical protein HY648_02280 [Acidobacteria bacterium]|nr:hypothetical protein [Acidobacteriota bacterium]
MEIWIGLEGEVNFETGDSQLACRKGEVVVIPADLPSFSVRPALPSIFLRTSPPLPQADLRGDLLAGGVSAEDLERVCFPEAPEGTDSPDFVEDSR